MISSDGSCHRLRYISATSTAAVRALRKLDAKKVCFVGPYIEEVTQRGGRFFEQSGFEVTGAHGMAIVTDRLGLIIE